MMKSYFEIGGEVICNETPLPTALAVPSEEPAIQVIDPKPVPGDESFIGPVQRSKTRTVGSGNRHYPYSIGVGRGNPLAYLAAYGVLYSVGILTSHPRYPNTTGEDRNLY